MGVFLFPFIPSSCWQSWTSKKYGMHITTFKKLVFAIFYGHNIIPCSKLLRDNGQMVKLANIIYVVEKIASMASYSSPKIHLQV
jgi:hypothetical protein